MSFKEVTKLRKNGQLNEALEMAKADLENDKSSWSYRALFWVLHDMCKQCLDKNRHQEASELVGQMQEILPDCQEEDGGVAQTRLNILERRLSSLNIDLRQADDESRNDRTVANAFTTVKTILEDETQKLDEYQVSTAGWIIYRYAKYALEQDDPQSVKRALLLYLKLDVEKPSMLHSSILRMAVDLEREFNQDFKFTSFLKMWGFDKFTDEDWERFTTNEGRQLPSLAEKAISRYCKELVDDGIHEVPDEFVQLIENARRRLHNDAKMEYNYARMLGAKGDVEQAVEVYKRVTRKIPQAYVWQEMADHIPDREIKQAVLCKVIKMQKENFLGKTRLQLAQMLIDDGNMAAAKRELDTYRKSREENKWRVESHYFELYRRIPAGTQVAVSNEALYGEKIERLTAFMYPDAQTAVMVYNGKPQKNKRGKLMAKLVAADGTSMNCAPSKLPRHQSRQQCYFYTVRYVKNDNRIEPVSITPVDTNDGVAQFTIVSGNLSIRNKPDGKRFGFVDECYVHQSLLGNLTDGQQVRVVAVRSSDGRLSAAAVL